MRTLELLQSHPSPGHELLPRESAVAVHVSAIEQVFCSVFHLAELTTSHILHVVHERIVRPSCHVQQLGQILHISALKADQYATSLPQPQSITARVSLVHDLLALAQHFVSHIDAQEETCQHHLQPPD